MAENKVTEDSRIKHMRTECRLPAVEADSLRDSLTDGEVPLRAADGRRERRPLRLLIGSLMLFFLLGVTTHSWPGEAGTLTPIAATESTTSAVMGRLIDLSDLSEERSTTMNRSLPLSFAIVTVSVVAVLAGLWVFFYNGLIGAREQVNSGWAQVENVYQRRLDLVPLLVDAVQTYTEHERETLTALTQARANAVHVTGAIGSAPQTVEQLKAIEAAHGKVESALTSLFAIVENYPDLKASQNFRSLQDQIEGTENRVAMERRSYNEFSRHYNTKLQTFPGNIVARMMGFDAKPYFEAERKALQRLEDPFARRVGG